VRVGFVGLGRMGRGMAHRLVDGGHDVAVYDVLPAAAASLVTAGARAASSVQDVCVDRDVVITMLVEDATVLEVALAPGGLRDSMRPGAVHLAMGTYGVATILELTAAHTRGGQHLVAAPVLGRPDLAAKGLLGIVAGGPADALETCTPLLTQIGRRIFRAGTAPVSATAIKLANNHLLGCALVSMAEALSLTRAHGIDPRLLYQVFTSAGFGGAAYHGYGRTMVEEGFDAVGSPVTVGLKDAGLIRDAATHAAVPMPSLNVYRDRLVGAVAHGDGSRDQAVLAREQNRLAGIEPLPSLPGAKA